MTLIEIKKELYKQKPQARFTHIKKGIAYYYADLEQCRVKFEIPVNDMGDASFDFVMDGKLLNRWITNNE